MEIVGKIIQILPLQEGVSKTGNPWKVQSYVLETQDQYTRKVCFEIFGEERIKNNFAQIDDVVTVSFDIESREYNGRWYTSIRAWRMVKGDTTTATTTITTPPASTGGNDPLGATAIANNQPQPGVFDAGPASNDSGDLPF